MFFNGKNYFFHVYNECTTNFNKNGEKMRISAIQPNYYNKVSFKAEENKQENKENRNFISRMDKNEKITAGVVSAAVVLAGLGYMGYKGKLGKSIQKLLGGAEDAAKNVKEQNVNPKPKTPESAESAPNKIEPPIKETAESSPAVKPEAAETSAKTEELAETVVNETSAPAANIAKTDKQIEVIAKEVNPIINIAEHKFMTIDEFKKLPPEESLKRAAQDIDIIDTNSSGFDDFGKKTTQYLEKLGIGPINIKKEQADILDIFCERLNSKYKENLKVNGVYNDFRLVFADVKFKKGDINTAEKLIMDVINESPIGEDRIEAYKRLHTIEQLQGKSDLFDKAVSKDVQEFNRINEYVHNLHESLAKTYGDGMIELTEKDSKLFNEALTSFYRYEFYFKDMVNSLEPLYGSNCESLNAVKRLNDLISKSPLVSSITE